MSALLKSLRLLGDPARVRLLLLLEREELSVAELQEILAKGKARSRLILAQLKQAGLGRGPPHRQEHFLLACSKSRIPTAASRFAANGVRAEIPEAATTAQRFELVLEKRRDKMRSYFDDWPGRFGREYFPGRSWQGLAEALLA